MSGTPSNAARAAPTPGIEALARSALFTTTGPGLPHRRRIELAYERSKAIMKEYQLTLADIRDVSARYWRFHTDPIMTVDGSAGTLLTIHTNLCIGTLGKFMHQPGVPEVVNDLLRFRTNGQFCLTELGHGLDAFNLETRADLLPSGDFILDTPTPQAAKYMPPTAPSGIPVVAVVFARLFVHNEDRGVKPFLVPLHDGKTMHEGITARLLTPRGGSTPVEHALTYFHHVRLPHTALLGDLDRAQDQKAAFFEHISRVIVGTMCMGAMAVSCMRITANIAARYSLRRVVSDALTGRPTPIISFPTQSTPVMTSIAKAHVLRALADDTHARFVDPATSVAAKHFVAAIFKITSIPMALSAMETLSDRCGAQGLFEVNQITVLMSDLRGTAIAEGDIQTLAIRFAVEHLLGRVAAPPTLDADHILARHEQGIVADLRAALASAKGAHRSAALGSLVLPQCIRVMQAIGHRMAYEAATRAQLDPVLVQVFVASMVKADAIWYAEHGVGSTEQARMERDAVNAALPRINDFVDALQSDHCVTAPIVSDHRWAEHVATLKVCGDDAAEGGVIQEALRLLPVFARL